MIKNIFWQFWLFSFQMCMDLTKLFHFIFMRIYVKESLCEDCWTSQEILWMLLKCQLTLDRNHFTSYSRQQQRFFHAIIILEVKPTLGKPALFWTVWAELQERGGTRWFTQSLSALFAEELVTASLAVFRTERKATLWFSFPTKAKRNEEVNNNNQIQLSRGEMGEKESRPQFFILIQLCM